MNRTYHYVEVNTAKHFDGSNAQREIIVYRSLRGGDDKGHRTYPFTPRNFRRAVGMLIAMQPAGWDMPAQEEPLPFDSLPPAEWDEPTPEEVARYWRDVNADERADALREAKYGK